MSSLEIGKLRQTTAERETRISIQLVEIWQVRRVDYRPFPGAGYRLARILWTHVVHLELYTRIWADYIYAHSHSGSHQNISMFLKFSPASRSRCSMFLMGVWRQMSKSSQDRCDRITLKDNCNNNRWFGIRASSVCI